MKKIRLMAVAIGLTLFAAACTSFTSFEEEGDGHSNHTSIENRVIAEYEGGKIMLEDIVNEIEPFYANIAEDIIITRAINDMAEEYGIEVSEERIEKEMESMQMEMGHDVDETALRKQAKQWLIDDKLIERMGEEVEVSEESVKRLFESRREYHKMMDVKYLVLQPNIATEEYMPIIEKIKDKGMEEASEQFEEYIQYQKKEEAVMASDFFEFQITMTLEEGAISQTPIELAEGPAIIKISYVYEDQLELIRDRLEEELREQKGFDRFMEKIDHIAEETKIELR